VPSCRARARNPVGTIGWFGRQRRSPPRVPFAAQHSPCVSSWARWNSTVRNRDVPVHTQVGNRASPGVGLAHVRPYVPAGADVCATPAKGRSRAFSAGPSS
jgi:hypothetical protein